MDDTLNCPICGKKMRAINRDDRLIFPIGKQADFIERLCIQGLEHSIQMFVDKVTKRIDFISLSLNPKNSRYIEIDLLNKKCRISCMKNSVAEYIEIPKMIYPDFPKLEKLKEKVSLYVIFS